VSREAVLIRVFHPLKPPKPQLSVDEVIEVCPDSTLALDAGNTPFPLKVFRISSTVKPKF
jgi:hypothetical protein